MVAKTAATATVSPVLSIGLAPVATTALPSTKLSYTATVTNTGANLTVTGTITAQATSAASATIASYYDYVGSTRTGACPAAGTNDGGDGAPWSAMAGTSVASAGYTPKVTPPASSGMQLKASPVTESGVTYPSSGDSILGTVIAAGDTARWNYTASIFVTPVQVGQLLNPADTVRIRNEFHLETAANGGSGVEGTGDAEFCNQLFGVHPSGNVTNASVTISLPDGTTALFNPTSTPGLANIASGGSVSVTSPYTVPAPPVRGSSSDSSYTASLNALNKTTLRATATVSGTAAPGPVSASSQPDVTTEQLPILGVTKSGPGNADPGSTANYPLDLANSGAAAAASLSLTDAVAGGATGTVTGVPATLDAGGSASAQASYTIPSGQAVGPLADTASVTWTDGNGNSYGPVSSSYSTTVNPPPVPPIVGETATEAVNGNFFSSASGSSFTAGPSSTPVFGLAFPTVDFNPRAGTINGEPANGPTSTTQTFTDVTTDLAGNFSGTITAQGNGSTAGDGNLSCFDAVFTSSFIVTKRGAITYDIIATGGFELGVGGSATRVNGTYENAPASNQSAINGYPLVGTWDQGGAATPSTYSVTVNFPTAGTYPYELDYFDNCAAPPSLTMTVATFTAPSSSTISVFVGYADGLRPAGSIFPYPWLGSPNVVFEGCNPNCTFDGGAIRVDNSTNHPVTINNLQVNIGSCPYAMWPNDLTLNPGQIMIFAQEASGATSGCDNQRGLLDTSDLSNAGCGGNDGVIPTVTVTADGQTATYKDTGQVLNTFGYDLACQHNESQAWQLVGGQQTTIDVPLPPAASLAIAPATTQNKIVGQSQNVTVAAMGGGGPPVQNLSVKAAVFGPNALTQTLTTGSDGSAQFSYTGTTPGSDSVQATAFVGGLQVVSNTVPVDWAIPIPAGPGGTGGAPSGGTPGEAPPAIGPVNPADGSVVTQPVPITASITEPAGQTIASWTVAYQAANQSNPTQIASGTGSPPATLATFDPTLVPDGTYSIIVTATASGGGVQVQTSSVAVSGNLKLGRYTSTYNDLSVSVNGLPMTVSRTYDSTDKTNGDFGVGWHVSVSNFRTSSNRAIGAGGWVEYPVQCFIALCTYGLKTTAPHDVTITWPTGRQEVFDFTPQGQQGLFYWFGTAGYTARAGTGTTDTLAPVASDASFVNGFDGNLYSSLGGPLYDPTEFQLTTPQGDVYVLSATSGLLSETDRNGNGITVNSSGIHSSTGPSINFTRDSQGRITTVTGPAGQHLQYGYSAVGDLATFTDADGNVTNYSYDGNHDLTGVTGPDGNAVETLNYDASGRLQSVTNGNGVTTTLSDDVSGRQQVVHDATGNLTTAMTYDALGDVVSSQQIANGKSETSTFTYDSLGRELSATDPLGNTTTYTYDANGDMTSVTDPDHRTTTIAYNTLDEPTAVTGPKGEPIGSYSYDSLGNLVAMTIGGTYTDQITNDAVGRPVSITNGAGETTTLGYDSAGHLISYVSPDGATRTMQVNTAGQLLSATDPDGAVTKYTYDASGNLTSTTDPNGGTTSFHYDGYGRLVSETNPIGQTTTYTYDGDGHVLSVTHAGGQTQSFTYDLDGRMLTDTGFDGKTQTYTYDGFGDLTSGTNATATDSLAYDADNRLTSITTSGAGLATQTVGYGYDPAGSRTSMTGPAGATTYGYNDLGLVSSITDPTGGVYGYTYNGARQLTGLTRPNGVDDTYVYDVMGDLVSLDSQTAGGNVVQQLGFGYTANGQVNSSTNAAGTTSYTYNGDGELTSETPPTGVVQNYAYDADGNPTETPADPAGSLVYNLANELTSAPGATFQYDGSGDLTQATNTTTSTTTNYTWSEVGQLGSVAAPSGTTTYGYDPLGRRVTTTDSTGTTSSLYDGLNLLAQAQPGGGTQTYVDGPSVNDPLEITQPAGSTDYFVQDNVGNTTALTTSSGSVADTYSYSPYGAVTSTGTDTNPLGFGGQQQDPTGLDYMHARYYDPTTERFLSPDPRPSPNPYTYAAGTPTNMVDPTGADDLAEYVAALKFANEELAYVAGYLNGIANFTATCAYAMQTPGADATDACSPVFLYDSVNIDTELAAFELGIIGDSVGAGAIAALDEAVVGEPISLNSIWSCGLETFKEKAPDALLEKLAEGGETIGAVIESEALATNLSDLQSTATSITNPSSPCGVGGG
ncbi:MAG TPA: RHS repeat-associated core domain-containing protein [Acidimicrobiales bacterium]|nr:RHS repeat-associated core domain-containing protein [Acidimicrobiales bacterium]